MSDEHENGDVEEEVEKTIEPRPWVRRLWARTIGVSTLYLKKPVLPPLSEYKNLFTRRAHYEEDDRNARGARGHINRERRDARSSLAADRGAEVRILRRLQFFKSNDFEPGMLDVGLGMRLGIGDMKLQPVARVRLGNLVTIKALPEPVIKLSQVLPFHFQGMQAHLRYEVPISAVMGNYEALWKQPARMLVRFEHGSNSGVHFYPGGIELGDHTIPMGPTGTAFRVAAGYSFPREFPYVPDNGGKIELHRLGIKALW
ncbi:hypothetical protein BSKO_11388 [Bryopsis sp. KO-2023]|nr:hypothetical protein BSKO_11388 [Bryopsis sp. KO-2023]